MLLATEMKRVFLFKEKDTELRLSDPNPAFTPDQVMDFYANTYDLLTTARLSGPVVKNDELIFKFESVLGTKG